MGRPARQVEVATERRRRSADTLDRVHGRRLLIPAQYEGDKDHHYYWANDEKGRIEQLTKRDDYDVVPGDATRIAVGQSENGQPLYAQLLRKPMQYHLADQREKLGELKKVEEAMTTVKGISDPSNPDAEKHSYAHSGNSIKSGTFTP